MPLSTLCTDCRFLRARLRVLGTVALVLVAAAIRTDLASILTCLLRDLALLPFVILYIWVIVTIANLRYVDVEVVTLVS
jgi:hypothetical protein